VISIPSAPISLNGLSRKSCGEVFRKGFIYAYIFS
jgi:hypothetical protein